MITRRELIGGIAALSSLFLLQGKSDNGHGKKKGHHKDMSNGLLTGLTEAWAPDATLVMVGQKTGLNTGTDAGLSYVTQAGFPGGHALQDNGGSNMETAASALLQDIGGTDFLWVFWAFRTTGSNIGWGVVIGEDNNNGLDVVSNFTFGGHSNTVYGEIPGAGGNYPQVFGANGASPDNTPVMIAYWYTTADSTMHISTNAGAVVDLVNTDGVAAPDPTNYAYFSDSLPGSPVGSGQLGPAYLWQGTAGVANAVSQLGSLYTGKLQYSDFDSGGGNPHTAFYGTLLQQGA